MSIVTLICLGAIIFFIFIKNNETDTDSEVQLEQVLSQVEKLTILPGEEPTLATVENTEELQDPNLKKVAETGDKVLLYYEAKKVIVYRPSLGKIVDQFPLILDASLSQAQDAKILIRSGNNKIETAEQLKRSISETYKTTQMQDLGIAIRQDYPSTIIIDLSDGQKYDFVSKLIENTGGKRGILPNGEPKPENTDILIITGLN